jgi:hypothetical protein
VHSIEGLLTADLIMQRWPDQIRDRHGHGFAAVLDREQDLPLFVPSPRVKSPPAVPRLFGLAGTHPGNRRRRRSLHWQSGRSSWQWRPDRHLEFNVEYTHFDVGGTVKQAGGKDVDFVMLSAAYRF